VRARLGQHQWRLRRSRELGEPYLRLKGLHGEVGDIEELKVQLRLRGIRRWCSNVVDFLVVAAGSPPVAAPLDGEEQGGDGMARERGRECGVDSAFTCERSPVTWRCWQGMNAMRWLGSELVSHAMSECCESRPDKSD
jgi:hypothetical protein